MPERPLSCQSSVVSANFFVGSVCGTTRDDTPDGRPNSVMSSVTVEGSPSEMPRSSFPCVRAAVILIPIGMLEFTVGVNSSMPVPAESLRAETTVTPADDSAALTSTTRSSIDSFVEVLDCETVTVVDVLPTAVTAKTASAESRPRVSVAIA